MCEHYEYILRKFKCMITSEFVRNTANEREREINEIRTKSS